MDAFEPTFELRPPLPSTCQDGCHCRNPNLGFATKARGCKVASQEGDLGVTSHAPGSAKNVR
jgi:hypothetical protein